LAGPHHSAVFVLTTEKSSTSVMENAQDEQLGQNELLQRLTNGFAALLEKVEDLARKNAEFEQQIQALRAKVSVLSGVLWQPCPLRL
jgi:predicted  nucleic acid-binding Zn-ribbon protein